MEDSMEVSFESLLGQLLSKYRQEVSYYQNKLEDLTKSHQEELEIYKKREKQYVNSVVKAKYRVLLKSEENLKLREILQQHNVTVPPLNELIEIKTISEPSISKDNLSITSNTSVTTPTDLTTPTDPSPLQSPLNRRSLHFKPTSTSGATPTNLATPPEIVATTNLVTPSVLTTPPDPSPLQSPLNRRSLRLNKPKKRVIYHERPLHVPSGGGATEDKDIGTHQNITLEINEGGRLSDNITRECNDNDETCLVPSAMNEEMNNNEGEVSTNEGVWPKEVNTNEGMWPKEVDTNEGVWPKAEVNTNEGVWPNEGGVVTNEGPLHDDEVLSDSSDDTVCATPTDDSMVLFTSRFHGNNAIHEEIDEYSNHSTTSTNRSESPSLIREIIQLNSDENNTSHDPLNVSYDPLHVSHDSLHVSCDPLHVSHDPLHVSHDPLHANKKRRKNIPQKSKKIKQTTMTQLMGPHPPHDIAQGDNPHIVPPTPFPAPLISTNWTNDLMNANENVNINENDAIVSTHGNDTTKQETVNKRNPQITAAHPNTTKRLSSEQELALRAGLPTYKCTVNLRKKQDRQKLKATACAECSRWYKSDNGLYDNVADHLQRTCRHRHLYQPPESDPSIWNIGFPDSNTNN